MNFITVIIVICSFGVLTITASPNGRMMNDVDVPDMSSRIAGGVAATVNQFPFMASVRALPGDTLCGGSLISNTVVLTAASCIFGSTSIIVGLGSINVVQTQTVTNYTLHPLYNPVNLNNNIAVIRLNTATTFAHIQLLNTANVNTDFTTQPTRVLGWGQTSTNGPMETVLRWVNKAPINNVECSNIYGNSLVRDSVICARGPTTNLIANACEGDIGSPLIWEQLTPAPIVLRLIALVSFVSPRGCTFGDPAGYTRISSYLTWINQQTGIPIPA